VAYAGKDGQGRKVYRWSSGHRSPIEAERALAKLHREIDQGVKAPRRGKVTVADFMARWLPTMEPPAVRPSTYSSYRMNAETHIIPGLGGFELAKLGTEELTRFYGSLTRPKPRGKGLSVKTAKNVHVVVRRALADAVRWGYVSTNVGTSVHLPRAPKPETKAWSIEQLRTFLEHVSKDQLYAMWLLFATTGLRRGEVAGLRWSDLALDKAKLSVRAPLVVVDYEVIVSEPNAAPAEGNGHG
jgi:integrase